VIPSFAVLAGAVTVSFAAGVAFALAIGAVAKADAEEERRQRALWRFATDNGRVLHLRKLAAEARRETREYQRQQTRHQN
jgi:hypothetical protein